MRYMMFIKHTEDYRTQEVPQSLYAAMGEFVTQATKDVPAPARLILSAHRDSIIASRCAGADSFTRA